MTTVADRTATMFCNEKELSSLNIIFTKYGAMSTLPFGWNIHNLRCIMGIFPCIT